MKERPLQQKVVTYLRANDWLVWKNHGSQFSPAGLPDLCAIKDGLLIAIELKVPSKKPMPVQLAWIADINDHGHYAFWGDNLPALKYLIEGICPNKQHQTR